MVSKILAFILVGIVISNLHEKGGVKNCYVSDLVSRNESTLPRVLC